jgi:transposase
MPLSTGFQPSGPADVERKRICLELIDEIGRLDTQLTELRRRTVTAVTASATTVADVYGVGPTGAAIIMGHTGGVGRFPSAGHFARFNGTAPIDASSGTLKRHRLNPRGNRQINHALQVAAINPGHPRHPRTGLLPPQDLREAHPPRGPTSP